jgi:preprotein translocase subunit SecG
MLSSILLTFHILVCVILIIVVLLQAGKGSTMGLSFGGGASQTVFGSSGGKNFFARLTTGLAVVFMITSILLSIVSSRSSQSYRGVMRQLPEAAGQPQPAAPDKAPLEVPASK